MAANQRRALATRDESVQPTTRGREFGVRLGRLAGPRSPFAATADQRGGHGGRLSTYSCGGYIFPSCGG